MARFRPKDGVRANTTTTGTGSYVISSAATGYQDFSSMSDGDTFPYGVQFGTNREYGCGQKSGNTVIRVAIYASTNGNGRVNWGPGTKIIWCGPLAENIVSSPDGSIAINDNPTTGATELQGFKISTLLTWFNSNFIAGTDIKVAPTGTGDTTHLTINHARTLVNDADGSTITLDLGASVGSTRHVAIAGNRAIRFTNMILGQVFQVTLNYDSVGGHIVQWPDEATPQLAVIKWTNGRTPAYSPIGGGSDSFEFQYLGNTTIIIDTASVTVPHFEAWIRSRERPTILDGEVTCNADATLTIVQGVANGPNEFRYLSGTIDSDYMNFIINRTGTVSGGTFDLTIGLDPSNNQIVRNIPYNITAYDLLVKIWAETTLTQLMINVDGGTDGADSTLRLTDSAASMHIVFIGSARYAGYVISVNAGGLIGGGTYNVTSSGITGGTQTWPMSGPFTGQFMKFRYNGNSTPTILCDANAATIEAAIGLLPGIGVGNIKVNKIQTGVYWFEFIGDLRATDVPYEITFDPDFLPGGASGNCTGQIYSTARNGSGPQGTNETNTITVSGTPTQGYLILNILGQNVTIPVTATSVKIYDLISTAIGLDKVAVTGGPLPGSPILIEFINDYAFTDVVDSTLDDSGSGAQDIDWEICNGKRLTLLPGTGIYVLRHVRPTEGESLHLTLTSDGASGTIVWSTIDPGIEVIWDGDAITVPADGESINLEFYAETNSIIHGRKWFGRSGGGGGALANQLLPGISIEITHDVGNDTFEYDNLERREILDDATTIICDGVAEKGVDKEVIITADRDIDANNFKEGETLRLKITQGTTGDWKVNYLFDIEWQEGFEPVLTTVPGKSDCFEMRCIRERGPYQVPAFKAWVETTERPQPLELTADPIAANEVQIINADHTPIGGTWTITFNGATTGNMAYNANAAIVKAAFQSLPTVGVGNVLVSGGRLGVVPFRFEFVNAKGGQDLPELTVQTGSLLF